MFAHVSIEKTLQISVSYKEGDLTKYIQVSNHLILGRQYLCNQMKSLAMKLQSSSIVLIWILLFRPSFRWNFSSSWSIGTHSARTIIIKSRSWAASTRTASSSATNRESKTTSHNFRGTNFKVKNSFFWQIHSPATAANQIWKKTFTEYSQFYLSKLLISTVDFDPDNAFWQCQ